MTCDRDHVCGWQKIRRLSRQQKRLAETIPRPFPFATWFAFVALILATSGAVVLFVKAGGLR